MGVWKILFSFLNFHSFSKRTRGGGHGQGPQKNGEGRVTGNLLLDSKFPGAGGVDRSLGPGDHSEEAAGLENLVFNPRFPRFGWERAPSRWNTRCGLASRSGMTPVRIDTKTFATRARARSHCTMECLPRLLLWQGRGLEKFGR